MKINRITLKNFRSIENESFLFNPNLTVLIGENGAGKTTILDALAFAMGTFFLGVDGISTYPISAADKRRVFVAPNSSEIQLPFRMDVEHNLQGLEYSWFRDTNKATGGSTSYKNAIDLIEKARVLTQKVRAGEEEDLPLLAYYGIGRASNMLYEKQRISKTKSRLDGYKNALDPRTMHQKASQWFKNAQTAVLQQIQDETLVQDSQLYTAFTNTLASMITDWESVQYNLKIDEVVGKFPDGSWTPLSYLSSGYKAIAALVMDIAYRAITLNPHWGEDAVVKTSGIVLIDEMDLYLHPKWQRTIVGDLKKAFPKIQFIVTTHSPFIVQSLKADELINLDGNVPAEEPDNLSLEDNAIFMGVENEYSDKFSKEEKIAYDYMKLLENEPDDLVFEQLEQLIDKTTDPVFKAKLQLERLAKFGK
ncbi:DUF2813 domain-containing protein [Ancylomarina euxinus]|uniref:DUF2813 domain-containing protein n=1 Tax=Ancylomarina euxinus TaxID=2283627 RepID=A0A425Y173_9BACT|nr:AAA family ATPase [Ancylomarina euxinus]MCZ4693785.1 AAA family ATPase [Ancylomarina euxinus]MUP15135.1 AAA family ATPase [Ancylomarina euxinus]RRG21558.1 DUF2813 domain-containing protein [Ancylomarina euxinus]